MTVEQNLFFVPVFLAGSRLFFGLNLPDVMHPAPTRCKSESLGVGGFNRAGFCIDALDSICAPIIGLGFPLQVIS